MLKRIGIYIVFAILIASVANRMYARYVDPGALFFMECLRVTERWAAMLREDAQPCYVFSGGSEVRMSVDTQVMLEKHNVRAINAGVQAGNGARCNAHTALQFLREGDTLIISCLPSDLENDGMSSSGVNFCCSQQGFFSFYEGLIPVNYKTISELLLGTSSNYCIYLMRILTRPENIYRYSTPQNARISESGRVEVFLLNEQQTVVPKNNGGRKQEKAYIPPDAMLRGWDTFLAELQQQCKDRGVKLVGYFSRQHVPGGVHRQIHAAAAIRYMELGIPILKDPYLGCWEDEAAYSDTAQHLSIEGGKQYSEFLAIQLKNNQYWTREELLSIVKGTLPSLEDAK